MKQTSSYSAVLDASALLACLADEPGHDQVDAVVGSAVNLAEVQAKLVRRDLPLSQIRSALEGIGLAIEPFTEEDALTSALFSSATHPFGLSLGDRACLALGKRLRLPVLTADRVWTQVRVGVQVRAIR